MLALAREALAALAALIGSWLCPCGGCSAGTDPMTLDEEMRAW